MGDRAATLQQEDTRESLQAAVSTAAPCSSQKGGLQPLKCDLNGIDSLCVLSVGAGPCALNGTGTLVYPENRRACANLHLSDSLPCKPDRSLPCAPILVSFLPRGGPATIPANKPHRFPPALNAAVACCWQTAAVPREWSLTREQFRRALERSAPPRSPASFR